ncbi:MAG: tetratricopeptide repeat protein [Acidobacteriota bacterium]|nr:tetratricopeptide repeat protein [Acidobacteriota bacterium]
MRTGGARLGGAAAVLAIYYWTLFAAPPALPPDAVEAQLQSDIQASISLFNSSRFADALAPTERIVEQSPGQAVHHTRLAMIYEKLDRPVDEARQWEAVMETSSTPIDACPMVAEAHRRSHRADLEVDALERCAGLSPPNPDFYLFLGQALLRAGRGTAAVSAFKKGLALAPSYPDLHLQIGIHEFGGGHKREARASFERFLALAPERRDEVAVWLARTAPPR